MLSCPSRGERSQRITKGSPTPPSTPLEKEWEVTRFESGSSSSFAPIAAITTPLTAPFSAVRPLHLPPTSLPSPGGEAQGTHYLLLDIRCRDTQSISSQAGRSTGD